MAHFLILYDAKHYESYRLHQIIFNNSKSSWMAPRCKRSLTSSFCDSFKVCFVIEAHLDARSKLLEVLWKGKNYEALNSPNSVTKSFENVHYMTSKWHFLWLCVFIDSVLFSIFYQHRHFPSKKFFVVLVVIIDCCVILRLMSMIARRI